MERITHKHIILYLVKKLRLKNKDIAEQLYPYDDSSKESYVSKVRTGKLDHLYRVDANTFWDNIFGDRHDCTYFTPQRVDEMMDFFFEQDVVTEQIRKAYEQYKSSTASITDYNSKGYLQIYQDLMMTILIAASETTDDKNGAINYMQQELESYNNICFRHFVNPISRNAFFGRESLIHTIKERLDETSVAIICGIGGLGKSYCALKYANLYSSQYKQIQQIFFTTDIKTTVLKIVFDGLDESHMNEAEKLAKRLSLLGSYGADTLLIIDNMNSKPDDTENFELLKHLPLHLIVTTRDISLEQKRYMIPINPLSESEQMDLFKHHFKYDIALEDEPEYLKIFQKVDGHTLLLEMIAKTMYESDMVPEDMLECLSNFNDDEMSPISIEKDDISQQEKLNHFVCILFDTSTLNEREKNLLMYLSLSSISGIERKLFKQLIHDSNNDTINTLISKSWVILEPGNIPAEARIHLHPVISSAIMQSMSPRFSNCKDYLLSVITAYNDDKKKLSKTEGQDICDILQNVGNTFDYETNEQLTYLLNQAQILWKEMYYSDSLSLYQKGISSLKEHSCSNSDLIISYLEQGGDVAVRLAQYNTAIALYQSAIDYIKGHNLNFPEKSAQLHNHLAVVYRKASQYQEALDHLSLAENLIDVHHLHDMVLKANILNDKGVVYINLEMYDKALQNYKAACKLREEAPEPDKKQLAYSYHNIGTVYQRQEKYTQAIEWHQKALAIRRTIYPDNEPIIAASLTMIGNDYTEAAHSNPAYSYADAKPYFDEGLNIRINTLGPNHPDVAWSYQSIGTWNQYQGYYKEALSCYQKCLAIRRDILGNRHAYTAEVLYHLGKTYLELGNSEEAQKCLFEAYTIQDELNKLSAKSKTEKFLMKV